MERPAVVVLGATGMLGHKVFQVVRAQVPGPLAFARADLQRPPFDQVALLQGADVVSGVDASDFESLHHRLRDLRPAYLVNCIGVIKQRDEARKAIPSITINSLLPHKLAAFALEWGGRLIHFSTDCVFDGKRGGYTETDASTAEDLYGKSKFLGEVACENALTLRTSIIGRELVEHRSLLDWFLAQNGKTVRGYTRVIYSGTTTNELARLVARLIKEQSTLHGLYQVVTEPITKYDLLCLIREAFDLRVEIQPYDGEVSDRSMVGEKLREAIGYTSPTWRELVEDLRADSSHYGDWGITLP